MWIWYSPSSLYPYSIHNFSKGYLRESKWSSTAFNCCFLHPPCILIMRIIYSPSVLIVTLEFEPNEQLLLLCTSFLTNRQSTCLLSKVPCGHISTSNLYMCFSLARIIMAQIDIDIHDINTSRRV